MTEIARDYVVIAWDAPLSDGNEKLLGYEVEKSMAGGAGTFVSAGYVDVGTQAFRVTRLHEGCDYLFRVSAENRVGLGPPAITERPVTVKLPFGEQPDLLNLCSKFSSVQSDCARIYVGHSCGKATNSLFLKSIRKPGR